MANLSLAKLPWYAQIGAFVADRRSASAARSTTSTRCRSRCEIAAQAKELSDIRGRISRGQAMARQLPEFRKEIGTLEARLESLKPILPDERDVGDLLRRVQTLATQSNLQVRGFQPQAITTKEMHAEWPIALQLEGNYHNLGLFLDRVSKFPRIINIGDLDIAAKDEPTAAVEHDDQRDGDDVRAGRCAAAGARRPTKKGKSAKKAPAKAPAKK